MRIQGQQNLIIILKSQFIIYPAKNVIQYQFDLDNLVIYNNLIQIMIQDDEHIIYVSEADVIAYAKKDESRTVKNAGFTCKKIVVTTKRVLIFQALKNRLQDTEYELISSVAKKTMKPPTDNQSKPRITVNGFPEIWIDIIGIESKVIIEQDPAVYKFLQKQGIQNLVKSVIGTVLLKVPKKMRFYILAMGGLSNAIKFAKAIICAQSWRRYQSFCKEKIKIEVNTMWVRVLTEIIYNDDSVVLVDPDLFLTGSPEEISAFIFLMNVIPFAHCFHHRYSITTAESAIYAVEFISAIQGKIHSLSFSQTHVNAANLKQVLLKLTLASLIKLDLSQNNLEDEVLETLNRLIKAGSKRLTYINLSKNKIKLANSQLLVDMIKIVSTILNLDLSHNLIDDSSTETFEKYVIFASNPPLEQLNLSHNKFSRKIAWRLYVGNIRNFKTHPYLRFILFPIPIKHEVFAENNNIDFPRHNTTINLNMHSALIEQFEQQSLLKHTFEQQPVTAKEIVTIRFQRVLANKVKLPMNKQELNRTLQISHKIQNFIKVPQSVEKISDMAMELKNFPFEVPPISRTHFIKFLDGKFNEALFIRDHYSVKYLLKALNQLGISVEGYADRLQRLGLRDTIFGKRSEAILNFEIDESKINDELDELVREGLRLYLEGPGIEIIYYLKYKRDQYIEKYLHQKLNPEHYLFELEAKKNISEDKRVSQDKFIVPYEIRLEKRINQNFYLHQWQANYQILSEMKTATFDECLAFLEQSEKKEKFTIYFERIEERIEFIKNEFTSFEYKRFKASYSDLKINSCRLIYLYNNIENTLIFLEIPIYVKRRLVTPEKTAFILNKEWFKREYHIVNYPNIRMEARRANIYNYGGVICRYQSEMFKAEVMKIFPNLQSMLKKLEDGSIRQIPMAKIAVRIVDDFKAIIEIVRRSLVPEEMKEELYLHLITWRRGRYSNNTEMIQLLTTFTMYIKPPLPIQKYLVAAILQNENVELADIPLCLATNPNEPTSDNVFSIENEFVERDWIPVDPVFCELLQKKGKVTITLELLEKQRIVLTVSQSKTVAELMEVVSNCPEMKSQDRQHFWLYKLQTETQEITAYECREHIGQILVDMDKQTNKLLLKRRIYSRQLKYNYNKYSESMIDSLYHDIKYEYIARNFFVNDKTAVDIAALIFMIQCVERYMMDSASVISVPRPQQKIAEKKTIEEYIYEQTLQIDSTFQAFLPRQIYLRLLKSKQVLVSQLKGKISERALKKQHNTIHEMKMSLLKIFSRFPQFMSSNYRVESLQKHQMCVSINAMFIYIESKQDSEWIHLQKLVSVVPKPKYLLLYYHKQENLMAQIHLVAPEKIIFSIIMDILAYCSLRMKMSSINLYEIHRLEELEKSIIIHEQSLKRVYSKNTENDLIKCREDAEQTARKVAKVSLTLMNFKQLQYFNKNRYIKSEISRKLYGNKTDRKLDFDRQIDEEEISEMLAANKKILQMAFPYHTEQQKQKEEPVTKKKNVPDESFDFKKEYEKLDFHTGLKEEDKKEEEMKKKMLPENYNQPRESFQSTTTKKEVPPKPVEPQNDDQPVVTNKRAKKGGNRALLRRKQ